MTMYAALLRAVNVGGTGKLPMAELRRLCEDAGFTGARTYIQSGNVVFASDDAEAAVQRKLERAVATHLGKPVGVLLRDEAALAAILQHNPFTKRPPNRVLVMFLDAAPPNQALDELNGPGGEEVQAHGREVYVYYPGGMGRSKLKLRFAATGTGRNINTVQKLLAMMRA